MTTTYGPHGIELLDEGSSTSAVSSFIMDITQDGSNNHDIVQANLKFSGTTEKQWLFSRFRSGSSVKNVRYRAAAAGASNNFTSTNSSLWATYYKNSNFSSTGGQIDSYAQFTIKHMHSDSNPYGATTAWCRYFLRCTPDTTVDLHRNDYTHAIAVSTGVINNIQCYFQNGSVQRYEFRVYGLGSRYM